MRKVTMTLTDAEVAVLVQLLRNGRGGGLGDAAAEIVRREISRLMKNEPEWRTHAFELEDRLLRSERRIEILKEMLVESVVCKKYRSATNPSLFEDGIPF